MIHINKLFLNNLIAIDRSKKPIIYINYLHKFRDTISNKITSLIISTSIDLANVNKKNSCENKIIVKIIR